MEASTSSAFAEWVSVTARGLGYRTDAQLAAALGVQQSTITRWRQGAQPQIKHLVQLARIFRMKIDPLLAMSGHVPPELLNESDPPGQPMTEALRRIRDAALTDFQRDMFLKYWERRMTEERERLSDLIDFVASSDGHPGRQVGEWLISLIQQETSSKLPFHVYDLIATLFAIEAGPRKRRRQPVTGRVDPPIEYEATYAADMKALEARDGES